MWVEHVRLNGEPIDEWIVPITFGHKWQRMEDLKRMNEGFTE